MVDHAAAFEIFKWIIGPTWQSWKCYSDITSNMVILNDRLKDLNCRKEDKIVKMNGELHSKDRPRKRLKLEVDAWFDKVEEINVRVKLIEEKAKSMTCFARIGLGKLVLEAIKEVESLYQEGAFRGALVEAIPLLCQNVIPAIAIGGVTTSVRNLEEIWACLMDEKVSKVGVFGMGGIGKTTVMKHIHNRLLEEREMFDEVIWVTVSKASSIIELQDCIAREIGLDFTNCPDETKRASKIFAEMNQRKRFVLILDDLWRACRLEDVGIPQVTAEDGRKIVLTTRDLSICNFMDCKSIKMQFLSREESLKLFLETVGHDVLSNSNLSNIVTSIVKQCECLPLSIVTTAGSLKGTSDLNVWSTMLENMRESSRREKMIIDQLKLSYNRLSDEDLQSCFLFCALFPRDYEIRRDTLIDYLIAEKIVQGRNRQVELERGQAMLNKLVDVCLLEDTRDKDWQACVKMHDLIRNMALRVASEKPRFLVEAGMGLKFLPDEENWRADLVKISLMDNNISQIHFESPNCPNISTLLLNGNPYLTRLPHNFFLHMKGLSFLNLSNTGIENLPQSIFGLANLSAFLLRGCEKLESMPSLENLTNLKRLDLFESGIKKVPKGMKELVKLKYLDLRCLSLNQVQEAKMRGEELLCLRKLESLYCVLNSLHGFNTFVESLDSECLRYYTLQLGSIREVPGFPNFQHDRTVHLAGYCITKSEATLGSYKILLPPDVENLAIQCSKIEARSLCDLTPLESVANLRSCFIDRCEGVDHLFSHPPTTLRGLEILNLYAAKDLVGLFVNRRAVSTLRPPLGTFVSLKELRICRCDNITKLYITGPLPNLEIVVVKECEKIVEIVSIATRGEQFVPLPKLWKLYLEDLPNLRTIPVVADFLQEIGIRGCRKLKRIPLLDREPIPPSLQLVLVDEDLWEFLEWYHPNAKAAILTLMARDFEESRKSGEGPQSMKINDGERVSS